MNRSLEWEAGVRKQMLSRIALGWEFHLLELVCFRPDKAWYESFNLPTAEWFNFSTARRCRFLLGPLKGELVWIVQIPPVTLVRRVWGRAGPSEPLPRDDGWLVLALVVAHCGAGGASGKLIISSEPRAATRTALPTIWKHMKEVWEGKKAPMWWNMKRQ